MHRFHLRDAAAPLAAIALAATLAGCDRAERNATAERTGDVVAQADRKGERAANQVGDKAKDMSITTAVNAELARDSELSALRINVDTSQGRVVLRGTAPDETARARAAQLALGTSGVVAVDNQLRLEPAK